MRRSLTFRWALLGALGLSLGLSVLTTAATPAPAHPSAAFKIVIAFYGLRSEPITTAELFFRGGTAYYFASESPEEIIIVNPADARLDLLDLPRKIQAAIPLGRLDEKIATLHRAIAGTIRKQEAAGSRSNRVAAEMSRSLNDPALAETFDPAALRLRLTNSAVTVDATGAPEPDAARLALIETALTSLIKLASARDPEAIPPFIRLDAVRALIAGHRLRPAELAFTYRLAGPPRKHRWTYHLVETLTPREALALDHVAKLRTGTPFVPFERYERRPDEPTRKKPAP